MDNQLGWLAAFVLASRNGSIGASGRGNSRYIDACGVDLYRVVVHRIDAT